MGSAADAYQEALAKLSPAERDLLAAVQRIRKTITSGPLRDITDEIVAAFARGVDRVDELLRDPKILRSLARLAGAIGDGIDEIAEFLTSGPMRRALAFFADESAKNVGPIVEIFESLVTVFVAVARAASGELGQALRSLARWIGEIADATSGRGGQSALSQFFADAMQPIRAFLRLGPHAIALADRRLRDLVASGSNTARRMVDEIDRTPVAA